MKISELMNTELITAFTGDSVQKCAQVMAEKNKGFLPVYNNNQEKKVMGVVSNADIVNKVVSKKISPEEIRVSEIMTKSFIFIEPQKTTSDAMMKMRKYSIKRLLVIEKGVLQGVVSTNDLINSMIKYKKELLDLAIDF